MKLVPVSSDDLDLYKSMLCDPIHMADLGGVQPEDKIEGMLQRQIAGMEGGKSWTYKVVPEECDIKESCEIPVHSMEQGIGTICCWTGEWKGEPVTEMGWGIAPKFTGNGFGSKAVALGLELAIREGRWGVIHVFTGVDNASSNALCRKCGFEFQGKENIDYDGRDLFTNHYIFNTQR